MFFAESFLISEILRVGRLLHKPKKPLVNGIENLCLIRYKIWWIFDLIITTLSAIFSGFFWCVNTYLDPVHSWQLANKSD